jgi:very-short-patch-repair endonuclease
MLSKALLNGEGPTYGNAQVGLLAMQQRLETFRREVAHWIEQQIFKPVAEWNGFIVEGERGQDEIIFPKISFDDLNLRDDSQKLQIMATANQQGVISNTSLIEAFGLDVDQEIERLRYEQGSSFMKESNFGTPSFSMNLQSGPVTGMGFGAAPMGAPGMAPGMAPPAAEATMGLTPPIAATKEQNYRLASKIINELYDEAVQHKNNTVGKRFASKRFKSAAHEDFIKSIMPVTGRGMHGPIPENYDGLGGNLYVPFLGGDASEPLNYEAHFELRSIHASSDDEVRKVIAAKTEKQMPKLHTSLEKKLYALLMSLNMPHPLYAQYSAGPNFDYQLDAAIPSLGIGIEADGEIWHNNFEKITKDRKRDSELANNGWIIVRFTDKELNDHPNDCIKVLTNAIQKRTNHTKEKITL